MSDMLFRKDDSGRNIFFPVGVWGKGYIVENDALADKIRKRSAVYTLLGVAVFISLGLLINWQIGFTAVVLWALLSMLLMRNEAKNLPVSHLRLTLRDAMQAQTEEIGYPKLIFMILCFGLFAAGSIFVLFKGGPHWFGGGAIVCTLGTLFSFMLFRLKRAAAQEAQKAQEIARVSRAMLMRRGISWICLGGAGVAVFLLGVWSIGSKPDFLGLSLHALQVTCIIVAAIFFMLHLLILRCPDCGSYVGNSAKVKVCPSCGKAL